MKVHRRGQATTEWMLLLSVIVIAVVAAGYGLAGTFQDDMDQLGQNASSVYTSGDLAN